MEEFKEAKVKIIVAETTCDAYKAGDVIYVDHSMVDTEKSCKNICLTALSAIYPFIYAARKRVSLEHMGFSEAVFRCPDCDEWATFRIEQYD
jgi:uncharacterized repeat protein (TIGR04076 family)